MIPKYRAFVKKENKLFETDDLLLIDFLNEEVMLQQNSIIYATSFDFDEVVLMQSTGLVDKEDTEVFEGDILHHQIQTEYTFIVKYDKDKGRWYGDGLSRTYRIDITKDFLQYYKVIGNIYENTELLEVE